MHKIQNKILYSGIIFAFIVGLSLTPVNAISPFTEIGNLEMEVLDAINDIIISLNAEIVRTDSLNSTQISEQSEQDGMQNDIAQIQTDIDALPTIIMNSLTDTNDSACESSVFTNVTGWCPPVANNRPYNITDTEIEETSFIMVQVDDTLPFISLGCVVIEIIDDSFLTKCSGTTPDGAKLYYTIFN